MKILSVNVTCTGVEQCNDGKDKITLDGDDFHATFAVSIPHHFAEDHAYKVVVTGAEDTGGEE